MGIRSLLGFYAGIFNENFGKVEDSGRGNGEVSEKFVTFSDWVRNTSFEESVFLAYNRPFRSLLFEVTFRELKTGTSAFFKKEQMKMLQNYETLANIVSAVLGGGKKQPDKVHNITSADQLQKALGSALNGE